MYAYTSMFYDPCVFNDLSVSDELSAFPRMDGQCCNSNELK